MYKAPKLTWMDEYTTTS